MNIDQVIVKPVLTEKATNLAKEKTYMFEIALKANKDQVKNTLEKLYSVKVGRVRIMIRKGKERRVGRRMKSKRLSDTKVAFVELIDGKIDLFPQA
ncbi:50S ribosomal protein L23 [Candidatus Roizmanbacteria bacterium]|nr:50S ribosomal protein L23 [Candidatus Roizmanbacteria bacterium]